MEGFIGEVEQGGEREDPVGDVAYDVGGLVGGDGVAAYCLAAW